MEHNVIINGTVPESFFAKGSLFNPFELYEEDAFLRAVYPAYVNISKAGYDDAGMEVWVNLDSSLDSIDIAITNIVERLREGCPRREEDIFLEYSHFFIDFETIAKMFCGKCTVHEVKKRVEKLRSTLCESKIKAADTVVFWVRGFLLPCDFVFLGARQGIVINPSMMPLLCDITAKLACFRQNIKAIKMAQRQSENSLKTEVGNV